ncbi:MAG: ComF family protein [Pseudomonadota bacterium]
MSVAKTLMSGLNPLIDLIYPPRCPLCGAPLAKQGGLCLDCWSKLDLLDGPETQEDIVAACHYNEISRQIVLKYKHGGRLALSELMAQLMAQKLPDPTEPDAPLLVPVPLHRWRLWDRGFNQSALLAKELAKCGKGDLCVDALVRSKRTPSLGGLGKQARRDALKNAIDVTRGREAKLEGRDVIIVDDVYTTGSTSSACVKAARNAGAANVRVVCFARLDVNETEKRNARGH